MKKENRIKGSRGERLAADYLCKKGHRILAKNYSRKTGEIDIISQSGETIVFTEVKYRKNRDYGTPAQAVDYRKQQHIIKTALWYLQEKKQFECNVRFDVVEIVGEDINHIENAFLMQ